MGKNACRILLVGLFGNQQFVGERWRREDKVMIELREISHEGWRRWKLVQDHVRKETFSIDMLNVGILRPEN